MEPTYRCRMEGEPGLTSWMGSGVQRAAGPAGSYWQSKNTNRRASVSRDVLPMVWTGPLARDNVQGC